ncbi:hypothetical protein K7432_000135 [Basidiobolus ranarum]|uniref:Uncharacterized protein n=1 Tax=Basidiobolus ranarum TaxID=34480 RepID=A0ABR2WBL7_9FUNG
MQTAGLVAIFCALAVIIGVIIWKVCSQIRGSDSTQNRQCSTSEDKTDSRIPLDLSNGAGDISRGPLYPNHDHCHGYGHGHHHGHYDMSFDCGDFGGGGGDC